MYSPEGSKGGSESSPLGRGEQEAAFSSSSSQRMQNKLRNVCLEALILRKEREKKKKKKNNNQMGRAHVHLHSLNVRGASCIPVALAAPVGCKI